MKDNAAYYQGVRDRDYRIQDQNIRTEIQQSRYNAEAEQYNLAQSTKAMDAFMDSIVNISATAKKAQDAALKKREEEVEQRVETDIEEKGPFNPASVKLNAVTDEEEIGIEKIVGNTQLLREMGVPEYYIQLNLLTV